MNTFLIMECATIYYDRPHYFPMHLHPDRYTFSYIIDGGAYLLNNRSVYTLEQGDLVIIPPYVSHQTLIESFFHYKVIRVPKLHSFVGFDQKKGGLTIIRNNPLYKDQYDQWFEAVRNNTTENRDVSKVFEQFLVSEDGSLSTSKIILKKALIHIENNFHRKISIEELSDITHLSESHFQRIFKSNIGISPTRYLQNLRIEKAKELIKIRNSFTDIAYDTGFFDQSHFNKYFKINVGMIPKRYADIVKR